MTRAQLQEFLAEFLGLCGCSEGDRAVPFLLDLLEAGEMRDAGLHAEAQEVLNDMLPDEDCISRNLPIYWITGAGLVEHGATLEAYGLSELGEVVLEALRTHGTGDDLWVNEADVAAPDGGVWN